MALVEHGRFCGSVNSKPPLPIVLLNVLFLIQLGLDSPIATRVYFTQFEHDFGTGMRLLKQRGKTAKASATVPFDSGRSDQRRRIRVD